MPIYVENVMLNKNNKKTYIIYNIVTISTEKELILRGNSTIPLIKILTKTHTSLTLH